MLLIWTCRVTGGFNLGAENGGPVVQVWGWITVVLFSLTVVVSLAEICSSYPTAGSLYYWAAQLAGPANSALASWITGVHTAPLLISPDFVVDCAARAC